VIWLCNVTYVLLRCGKLLKSLVICWKYPCFPIRYNYSLTGRNCNRVEINERVYSNSLQGSLFYISHAFLSNRKLNNTRTWKVIDLLELRHQEYALYGNACINPKYGPIHAFSVFVVYTEAGLSSTLSNNVVFACSSVQYGSFDGLRIVFHSITR
jgi:hypothetical protein